MDLPIVCCYAPSDGSRKEPVEKKSATRNIICKYSLTGNKTSTLKIEEICHKVYTEDRLSPERETN
jgi:hypothetical protein